MVVLPTYRRVLLTIQRRVLIMLAIRFGFEIRYVVVAFFGISNHRCHPKLFLHLRSQVEELRLLNLLRRCLLESIYLHIGSR